VATRARPAEGAVIQLRQITLPRSAIIGAVLEFRRAAEANGVTWLGLARQQLARECKLTHPCPTVLCHGQGCARSGGAETRRLG
jgi:hypothetical protein